MAITPSIKVNAKTLIFFDRPGVVNTMDEWTRAAFNYLGALTRTMAKKSMPNRPGPSKPGNPPHAHGRALLRELIYYGIDRAENVVVIGPAATYSSAGRRKTVPELHEFGGADDGPGKRQRQYPERAYMRPAFQRAVNNKKIQEAFDKAGAGATLARLRNG